MIKEVKRFGNGAMVLLPKEWEGAKVDVVRALKTKEEIVDEVLEILKPHLPKVRGIYLVGSYTRGEQTLESDVDILVIADEIFQVRKTGYSFIVAKEEHFLREGMEIINPYLAEEYQLANRLYAKRFPIAKHLSTKEIDQLISVGETGALIAGLADQNLGLLTKVLGSTGARKVAREVLINPRLQNLNKRMAKSIKDNKRIFGYDNLGGWHYHPLNKLDEHVKCKEPSLKFVLKEMSAVIKAL